MISKVINGTEQNVAGNGGGTNDYEALTNLPQINGNELTGDQTGADLGLVDAEEYNGIWKTQGEHGVKNLIPYPYDLSSITHRGITFNANSDGTVSFSGTADNGNPAVMQIKGNTASKRLLLKAGTYIISDGNINDTYGGISLYFYDNNTDNTAYSGTFTGLYTNSTPQVYIWTTQNGYNFAANSLYGYPKKFTIDSDAYVLVQARSVSNVITSAVSGTIYPMLRSANDTDKTYRPYAKTNKQLTDEISGNASDIDEIDERLDNTTTAVTGNPISISGLKSNQLAINPVVTLEPIQAGSGDPSPSNIRAISGYDKIEVLSTGENQLDYNAWKNCGVFRGAGIYENNGVTLTATSNDCFTNFYYPTQYGQPFPEDAIVSVEEGDIVTVSWQADSNKTGVVCIFGNGDTNSLVSADNADTKSLSYIVPSGITYITFRFGVANNGDTISYKNIHISKDKVCDIKLALGQTIYGGTLDVEKGILTVDKKCIDLGSLSFGYDHSNNQYYSGDLLNDAKIYSSSGLYIHNMICSTYPVDNRSYGELSNVHIRGIYTDYRLYIAADSDSYSFAGVQLVYELATPITIQLTPHEISLLKDYAHVSTNGTNIQFSYKNGEIASLGDVAQLGQTVNELGEYVDKNKIGYTKIQNSITITSTSHTVTNDGFLFGMITSTSGQVQYITINDVQVIGVSNNSIPVVFSVKAGDIIKTREGSAFTYLLFITEFGR